MAIDSMTLALINSTATSIAQKYQSIGIVNVQYVAPNTLKFTLANNTTYNIVIPSLHTHGNLSDLEKLSVVGGKLLFDGQPISGGDSSLQNSITVTGTTQGKYTDGAIIPAGTSIETIIKNMLITVVPPTYTTPTLSITGSGTFSVETGTSLTPIIIPTYTQNDAGSLITYTLNKDGTSIYTDSGTSTHTDTAFAIGDVTVSYQANVSYNAGAIKNDNTGNPYPTGQILAGNIVSNIIKYTGKRNAFYGTSASTTVPSASADIRGLSGKNLGAANGTSFTINIPVGAAIVIFAYKDTLQDVSSVKYVEGMNAEIKSVFTKTSISVNDASGSNAINYKVYYYIPATSYTSTATYNVTI